MGQMSLISDNVRNAFYFMYVLCLYHKGTILIVLLRYCASYSFSEILHIKIVSSILGKMWSPSQI